MPLQVSDRTRDEWKGIPPEEYPLVNAEHIRQLVEIQKHTQKSIDSIKSWVIFFGLLTILGMIVGACNVMFG